MTAESLSEVDRLAQGEQALAEAGPVPFHLPLGWLRPVVAGGFAGMRRSDWVLPGPRERVGAVLRGCAPERLVEAYSGARPFKVAPPSGAPGSRALHAVGLAIASGAPVLCFLGLASVASGAFHEALNAAVLMRASVVFLVAVARLDDRAPVGPQLAAMPAELARAAGLSVAEVEADFEAVRAAVAMARERGGPALIQVTPRPNT